MMGPNSARCLARCLMISGHWKTSRYLLSSSARRPMEFDYSEFPEHTYRIRYDAPGAPALAEQIRTMLERGGVASGLDPRCGYDHGTFTLMHTMYPEAEMPLLQLSLQERFDPTEHLKVGELLAPLRDEGVFIVGSGFSYHNMRGVRSGAGAEASATFDVRMIFELGKEPR
jgi:aromatic ring-opening dioxygenase catalytic subunit (LigB family)